MLVHLVALVIVPAIGMPVFAMVISRDRLDDAAAARRIAHGMEEVAELEELRSSLRDEALEAGVRSIAVRYGLDVDDLRAALDDFPVRPVAEARASTDAALGRMDDATRGRATLTDLAVALEAARREVDASLSESVDDPGALWRVYLRYSTAYELIGTAQRESLRWIRVGRYGDASSDVLEAVAETAQSLEVAELLFHQMAALQGLATAPGPDEESELVRLIESDQRARNTQFERLPDVLSDAGERDWDRLRSDPEFTAFDEFLSTLFDAPPPGSGDEAPLPLLLVPGFVDAATAVIPVSESLGDLMGRSVDRGVRAAERDQADAVDRARVAVLAGAGVLVVTCILLVLVGGSMRRELNRLATAAGQLRTGRLRPVPVEGPREIASVAEALNDAIANLGSVSRQAEMLAAGQMEDLADQPPVPGELGSAMHASIGRVVDVVRELERLRTELAHQAAHDRLTGLVNRAEGERLLAEAIATARRTDDHVAILFVDLDDFKDINDTLGHAAGDLVLVTVAHRMVGCVRPGDTVCRLGGDEFLVILDGSRSPVWLDDAMSVAERIRQAIVEPISYEGATIVASASTGIALTTRSTDPAVLRSHADTAMYRAKAAGPNGVQVYDSDLDASGLPRRRLTDA